MLITIEVDMWMSGGNIVIFILMILLSMVFYLLAGSCCCCCCCSYCYFYYRLPLCVKYGWFWWNFRHIIIKNVITWNKKWNNKHVTSFTFFFCFFFLFWFVCWRSSENFALQQIVICYHKTNDNTVSCYYLAWTIFDLQICSWYFFGSWFWSVLVTTIAMSS